MSNYVDEYWIGLFFSFCSSLCLPWLMITCCEFWDSFRSWDSLWNLWDMHLFKAYCFTGFTGSFVIWILLLQSCSAMAMYCVVRISQSSLAVKMSFASWLKVKFWSHTSYVTEDRSICSVPCLVIPQMLCQEIPVYQILILEFHCYGVIILENVPLCIVRPCNSNTPLSQGQGY